MKYPHLRPQCTALLILILAGCAVTSTPNSPAPTPTRKAIIFSNTVVSLTFDDGDADNYQIRPVLAENNLHATFYIVSGFIGTEGYMTEDQLRGLYQDGHEIGGHTHDHIKLTEVRGADLRYQVCQNRLDLLALGFDTVSFAYPYGHYDDEAKQTVIDCGYNSARVVTNGPETIPARDAYTLGAMPYIVEDTGVDKIQRYIKSVSQDGGGWAILTFHHVCDQCDHNSISPDAFASFAQWLNKQQQETGLLIKTVGEVVGGDVKAGVQP